MCVTVSMEIFKSPPSLSFTSGNLAEQWRRWKQQFGVYYTATELVKKEARTRVAILLHCAGPEAQDIHSNFVFSEADGGQVTITVCSKSSKSIASSGKMRCSSGKSFGSLTNMKVKPLTSG